MASWRKSSEDDMATTITKLKLSGSTARSWDDDAGRLSV